jgi:hypothetical protein
MICVLTVMCVIFTMFMMLLMTVMREIFAISLMNVTYVLEFLDDGLMTATCQRWVAWRYLSPQYVHPFTFLSVST